MTWGVEKMTPPPTGDIKKPIACPLIIITPDTSEALKTLGKA